MKNVIIIASCFLLVFSSCKKEEEEPDLTKLLQREWSFKETPQKNLNNYQGNVEDRTVFNGNEKILFSENGTFHVDGVEYGEWVFDETDSSITITQTPSEEYSCCGNGQTTMDWEIEILTEDEMIVNHPYYTYIENVYKFK